MRLPTLILGLAWVASFSFPLLAQPAPIDLTQRLEPFDRYVEESRQAWGTPGLAVALVADGKVIWSKGYGVRESGKMEAVASDTVFQIGSLSKSFTACLVAIQVDRGKLRWKDRVVDHYPDFRMFDPWVTREFRVEDTMAQRSGQPAYATDLLAFLGGGREELLQAMRLVRPVSSFRSEFAYVNNLWLVSAKLVEKAAGESWEQSISSQLFGPLKMSRSSTGSESLFGEANHATPHLRTVRGAKPLPKSWPFTQWVYTYGPAGGVNSTVLDMAQYLLLHLGNKSLVSQESLTKLHTPHTWISNQRKEQPRSIPEVAPVSYCQGWLRQEMRPYPLIWHNGGTSGCKTVAGFVPEAGIGIVVLSNLADTELPEALMYRFYDLYFGHPDYDYSQAFLKAKPKAQAGPKRPAQARPPADLNKYAGLYRHPVYGLARIEPSGSNLQMTIAPNFKVLLSPWDGDTFLLPDFLDPDGTPDFARFLSDSQGNFPSLQLGPFRAEGNFQREGYLRGQMAN